MHDNTITRRKFLESVAASLAASVPLVSSFSGCAVTGLVVYPQRIINGKISIAVANYAELNEVGGAIELNVERVSDPIVVVRKGLEELVALSPICTHLGCTVRKEAAFFRCPCHGSTYTLDGTVVRGPAEKALVQYRTEFVNGNLVIYL